MIKDLQQEILRIKKEKDVCILAHSYQAREILEIADFVGDSFELSKKAATAPNQTMLMCGVRFMAETVKILSPEKTVWLAHPDAGCPMAQQFTRDEIAAFKQAHPEYTVVAYVNTTAALKSVCDVCVTSASAVDLVSKIESDHILFIPDCNLGSYVADMLPHKEIRLMQGGCPVHTQVTPDEVAAARATHPNALLLVHPECVPAVSKQADFIGSTSAIMAYAKSSDHTEFIIGTDMSIAEHLQYDCPDKRFYPLSKKLLCPDMRLTTLMDVWHCLNGNGGAEIQLDDDTLTKARRCIDRMIQG